MSRHMWSRPSSVESLCVFCACRLAGQTSYSLPRSSPRPRRRDFTTSKTSRQTESGGAAPTSAKSGGNFGLGSSNLTPQSSLSQQQREEIQFLAQERENTQKQRGLAREQPNAASRSGLGLSGEDNGYRRMITDYDQQDRYLRQGHIHSAAQGPLSAASNLHREGVTRPRAISKRDGSAQHRTDEDKRRRAHEPTDVADKFTINSVENHGRRSRSMTKVRNVGRERLASDREATPSQPPRDDKTRDQVTAQRQSTASRQRIPGVRSKRFQNAQQLRHVSLSEITAPKAQRISMPGFISGKPETNEPETNDEASQASGWGFGMGMGSAERPSTDSGHIPQADDVNLERETTELDTNLNGSGSKLNTEDSIDESVGFRSNTSQNSNTSSSAVKEFLEFEPGGRSQSRSELLSEEGSVPDRRDRMSDDLDMRILDSKRRSSVAYQPIVSPDLTPKLGTYHVEGASSRQPENSKPDDWKHFRPVAREAPSSPPKTVLEELSGDGNGSEIDRIFERHRAQRDAQTRENLPPSAPQQTVYNPFKAGDFLQRVRDAQAQRNPQSEGSRKPTMYSRTTRDHTAGEFRRPDRPASLEEAQYQKTAHNTDPEMSPRTSRAERFSQEISLSDRMMRSRLAQDRTRKEKEPRRRQRDGEEDGESQRRPRHGRHDVEDEGDFEVDEELLAIRQARREAKKAKKEQEKQEQAEALKAQKREQGVPINLPQFISVSTLAQALNVRYEHFVARLERLGYDDVFPGKVLNAETSGMIAMEYGFNPEPSSEEPQQDRDLKAQPEPYDTELLPARPPVVTIMGHVDHGKTTILDYLRKSSVAAGEAGGITQHIGAFSVPLESSGRTITFLDTPGHAAFLDMRQRGANVTDIVVLVVAADDSVKPQTLEALKHARGAGVPIIVAVNKIDKPEADLSRVKQDLARHEVEIEDYGGDTQVVPVSGKTGEGMDALEEAIVTQSEILDHRAANDGPVEGWVIEATTKKAGRTATVLVKRGTLKAGDIIVAGKTWARVRTLHNEGGQVVHEAPPGTPVAVDGWRDQPLAGDEVLQAENEQQAGDVVEYRLELAERQKATVDVEAINEARRLAQGKREQDMLDANSQNSTRTSSEPREQSGGQIQVPLIIKADVSGSVEAVSAYIMSLSSPLVAPKVIYTGVGKVNESDIDLADATQGHIISFNLPVDDALKGHAAANNVKILENNIIYRVLDDVKEVLEDTLAPILTQKVIGEADISTAFEISIGGRKTMKIAGCKIRNGTVNRGSRVRVLRGEDTIYDGTISSLKSVKKDVQEMRKGTECGMGFEGWEGFQDGDQLQTYREISEKRRL